MANKLYCKFKLKFKSIKKPLIKGPKAEPTTITPAAKDFIRPREEVPKHSAQKALGIMLFEPAVIAKKINPIEKPTKVSQTESI